MTRERCQELTDIISRTESAAQQAEGDSSQQDYIRQALQKYRDLYNAQCVSKAGAGNAGAAQPSNDRSGDRARAEKANRDAFAAYRRGDFETAADHYSEAASAYGLAADSVNASIAEKNVSLMFDFQKNKACLEEVDELGSKRIAGTLTVANTYDLVRNIRANCIKTPTVVDWAVQV